MRSGRVFGLRNCRNYTQALTELMFSLQLLACGGPFHRAEKWHLKLRVAPPPNHTLNRTCRAGAFFFRVSMAAGRLA